MPVNQKLPGGNEQADYLSLEAPGIILFTVPPRLRLTRRVRPVASLPVNPTGQSRSCWGRPDSQILPLTNVVKPLHLYWLCQFNRTQLPEVVRQTVSLHDHGPACRNGGKLLCDLWFGNVDNGIPDTAGNLSVPARQLGLQGNVSDKQANRKRRPLHRCKRALDGSATKKKMDKRR